MALYELSDEQRTGVLQIIDSAMIPGKAARMVASIQRALATPVAQAQRDDQHDVPTGAESTD